MYKKYILGLLCLLQIVSCQTSTLVKSWSKDQYLLKQDPPKKIMLIALTNDQSVRKEAEEQMKSNLSKNISDITTSYKVMDGDENMEKLMNLIKAGQFTHIITLRLADKHQEVEYTPGIYSSAMDYYNSFPVYYRDYGTYLQKNWTTTYQPESFKEYTEYILETNVYSIKNEGLIYSAFTSSFKGTGFDKTINATLTTIRNDMKKKGFFKKDLFLTDKK